MFRRFLIPLDGSRRSEWALPVAARMARASGGSIVLLRVVPIPGKYGPYLYESSLAQSPLFFQEVLDLETVKAKAYLAALSRLPVLEGIAIETEVLTGAVEPTISRSASEQHVDLIIMCSHGDTGFKRWVVGRLSQKLARHSPVPALVLYEGGSVPTSSFPDPLRPLRPLMGLVALDGSERAEAVLLPAANLVAALAAPARGLLLLARVVNLAGSDPRLKEAAFDEAKADLSAVAERLRTGLAADLELSIVTSIATGKDVAKTLLNMAADCQERERRLALGSCDLMALATHGRGGLQRLAMGSVTERVLGAAQLPVLVIRPQDVPEPSGHKPSSHKKTEDEMPAWSALF